MKRPTLKSLRRVSAEVLGTFWLVLAVCGTALLSANVPDVGIGYLGISLAVGFAVLTGAAAFSSLSGAHFNPAVTIGMWAGGRFAAKDIAPYIGAQLVGGVLAAAVAYVIASGAQGFDATSGFASNGYGLHSPQGYSLAAGLVTEFVLTFIFVMVILNVTTAQAPAGFAPLGIGITLVIIHLIAIPVTNCSVNPARSIATALFQGGWALEQLWAFWVAPIAGGVAAGYLNSWLEGK